MLNPGGGPGGVVHGVILNPGNPGGVKGVVLNPGNPGGVKGIVLNPGNPGGRFHGVIAKPGYN